MPRKDSTTFALRNNNAVAGVDTPMPVIFNVNPAKIFAH